MKKILFITHDTSRTGAPILLLSFIKWFKQAGSPYQIDILSLRKGALSAEFASLARHYLELEDLIQPKMSLPSRVLRKITNRILPASDKKKGNYSRNCYPKL